MSAPKRALRDAEGIRVGFLAARASSALTKVLQQADLTADESADLAKATLFLTDIADGVRLTSRGDTTESVRPSRSIAALDVALGPLDQLREFVKAEHQELEPMFRRFSDAVLAAQARIDIEKQLKSITEAQVFFEGLSGWLANEIATRKRHSVRAKLRSHNNQ
jgi:hypothetical protein